MKKMEIHGWGCPDPTSENYERYKAAGFTTVLYFPGDHPEYGVEEAMGLFDDLGLDYIIGSFSNGWTPFPPACYKADYMAHKGFKGAFMFDEPSLEEHVPFLVSGIEDFERNNPGKQFRFNMALGWQAPRFTPEEYPSSYQRVRVTCDWECAEILDRLHGAKVASTDYYPLLEDANGNHILQHDYLFPLEYLALLSKKHGYEFFLYIQSSGGWGNYGEINDYYALNPAREIKTVEDVRFQVLCGMVYGVTGIGYFTYGTDPNFRYAGLNDRNDEVTEKYYLAKTVNEEIHAIEDIYLSFSWQKAGVILSGDPAIYALSVKTKLIADAQNFDCIKGVRADRDVLIGEFTNGDGDFAHWIVNYIEPSEQAENIITITPDGKSRIRAAYKNGKKTEIEETDGEYVFKTKTGDGIFVIWEKIR